MTDSPELQKGRNSHDEPPHRDRMIPSLLAMPNLFLRSAVTMVLLYALLTLCLITMVQLGFISATTALASGIIVALFQFICGPWLMDLVLNLLFIMRWVEQKDLPPYLVTFVERVSGEQGMKFPQFGIIEDGAPQAFTYGHHPNNARIVISRGLMEILTSEEVCAVVGHEIGHARNWDMVLMVLANLVPLILYYLYTLADRLARDGGDKIGSVATVTAIIAYFFCIVTEYIVLWFSRTREYNADRFSGLATGNPNLLSNALIKIAYGLAASEPGRASNTSAPREKKGESKFSLAGAGPLGAFNLVNRNTALRMVTATAPGDVDTARNPDIETAKNAMQWDLWNPWASYYELNSTHPLIAKRLLYISNQALTMGQEPAVVFDRTKPESYWDDFLLDLFVLVLPLVGLVIGIVLGAAIHLPMRGGTAFLGYGIGKFIKTYLIFHGRSFPKKTVSDLMGQMKVSPVRPIEATLSGKIVGKGVPGLIYSEDFILRDSTGIILLDYRQPLNIWNFLFGLWRASSYQGKDVRVTGWFRRSSVPYFDIFQIEDLSAEEPIRTCYTYYAVMGFSILVLLSGILLIGVSLTTNWLGQIPW